jgi:transposase-like protein
MDSMHIYEPYTKKYLLMNISEERTLLVCYNFIKELRRLYGNRYTIYTDGASYDNQACRWLRIKHIVYDDNYCKNIMERAYNTWIELSALMITLIKMIAVIRSILLTGLEYL